jgi:hypothetical protein
MTIYVAPLGVGVLAPNDLLPFHLAAALRLEEYLVLRHPKLANGYILSSRSLIIESGLSLRSAFSSTKFTLYGTVTDWEAVTCEIAWSNATGTSAGHTAPFTYEFLVRKCTRCTSCPHELKRLVSDRACPLDPKGIQTLREVTNLQLHSVLCPRPGRQMDFLSFISMVPRKVFGTEHVPKTVVGHFSEGGNRAQRTSIKTYPSLISWREYLQDRQLGVGFDVAEALDITRNPPASRKKGV